MREPEQVIFTNMCMVYDHEGNVRCSTVLIPNGPA